MEKITNTSKVIYKMEQNTIETSKLGEEEFLTPHALSL
jgi:hypothetical protein